MLNIALSAEKRFLGWAVCPDGKHASCVPPRGFHVDLKSKRPSRLWSKE